MTKLVSMSVYGDNPRYIKGAIRQIQLIKEFLPSWGVRIYVDSVASERLIGCGADIIKVSAPKETGVFWRFLPLFESENNITMVQDADSRITVREVKALEEFLFSDKKFHTFKDHDAHFQFPILAGCFTYKGSLPQESKDAFYAFLKAPFYYTNDQVWLRDHVWPVVEKDAMVHSMAEGWFAESRKQLVNRYCFCGNGWDENDMPLYPPSLFECTGFDPQTVSTQYKFDKGILNEF